MPTLSETEIIHDVLEGLHALRIGTFWRNNNLPVFDTERKVYRKPGKNFIHGISDILGIARGVFFAIEVKTVAEHAKVLRYLAGKEFVKDKWEKRIREQADFIRTVEMNGGHGFFACDWRECNERVLQVLSRNSH